MSDFEVAPITCLVGKAAVAIAGVIAMRPVLSPDEPTAMLDPVGRREVLETIKR